MTQKADLCDHFMVAKDHRCRNYAVHEVVLLHDVEMGGKVMFGTYPAGRWAFCNMHYRIFQRDRQDQ